jgi:hypothetical protein
MTSRSKSFTRMEGSRFPQIPSERIKANDRGNMRGKANVTAWQN